MPRSEYPFLVLLCFAIGPILSPSVSAAEIAALAAQVFQPIDVAFSADLSADDNPYSIGFSARLAGPEGAELTLPGFHAGERQWAIRFSPTRPGVWTGETISSHPGLAGRKFRVEAAAASHPFARGAVQIDPQRPRHFAFTDGTPFHLLGYELNWLWALDRPELDALLGPLASAGFNYALINSYAYDTAWSPGNAEPDDFGPPPVRPWPGPAEQPDHTRLNPEYWRRFDRMMEALFEHGVVAHLYVKVYNKKVVWPKPMSPEDALYFDHLVARYQAYPNIVWDFSKESYNEPDKAYMIDRLRRIRARDAYGRLVTVHDDKRVSYTEPGRSLIDFVTDQNHRDHYWIALDQRRRFPGPIFNAEYAYEHGPDSSSRRTWGENDTPQENIRRAYEVAMAGAYGAHYYSNHAWDIVRASERSQTLAAYQAMRDFLTGCGWREFEPLPVLGYRDCHIMTNRTRDEMLIFIEHGRFSLSSSEPDWFPSEWSGEAMDVWTTQRWPVTFSIGESQNRRQWTPTLDRERKAAIVAHLKRQPSSSARE